MVYLVRVKQPVAAQRIQHIVHVTVVWCEVVLRAIPQVQVLESVKVHTVETVNVVPQGRERRCLTSMCLRTRHTSISFGLWNFGDVADRSCKNDSEEVV